jgi:hypothetical protein
MRPENLVNGNIVVVTRTNDLACSDHSTRPQEGGIGKNDIRSQRLLSLLLRQSSINATVSSLAGL